jgi:hypothetical protein
MEHVLVRSSFVDRHSGDSSDMGLDRDKTSRIGGGLRHPIARAGETVGARRKRTWGDAARFVIGVVLMTGVFMALTGASGYVLTGHWRFLVFGG